jgi:hypothetical protein
MDAVVNSRAVGFDLSLSLLHWFQAEEASG